MTPARDGPGGPDGSPLDVGPLPFVGRDDEVARIRAALEPTLRGAPSIVLVGGETGIGKTRLLEEVSAGLAAEGWLVARGDCFDLGQEPVAFGPFLGALRMAVRDLPDSQRREIAETFGGALGRLIPGLGRVAERPDQSEDELARASLFSSVLGLLDRLAQDRPVLLVTEDVHWADRSSLDLLAFLVRSARSTRIAMAMTFQRDVLAADPGRLGFVSEVGRLPGTTRVDLGPLSREALGQLLGARGYDPDDAALDVIQARSDGNPFLAQELLTWRTLDPHGVPPTVRDGVLARLGRQTEAVRSILASLAIAGTSVPAEWAVRHSGLPRSEALDALRSAARAGFLEVSPDTWCDYRHVLIRDAVYADILPPDRQAGHRRAAELIEADPDVLDGGTAAATGALALHWARSGSTGDAFRAAVAAARAAASSYAFAEALTHYRHALEAWDGIVDAATVAGPRFGILSAAADCAMFVGQLDLAETMLREARSLIDVATDAPAAGLIHERLGGIAQRRGDWTTALAERRTAVDLVPGDPPTPERARVVVAYAKRLHDAGRHREADPVAAEALRVARAVGARGDEALALAIIGQQEVEAGDVEAGLARLYDAVRIARESGSIERILVTSADLIWAEWVAGHLDVGIRAALERADFALEKGALAFERKARAEAAYLLAAAGRLPDALVQLARAGAGPVDLDSVFVQLAAAAIAVERGDLAPVADLVRGLAGRLDQAVEPQYLGDAMALAITLAVQAGRLDDARAIAERIDRIESEPDRAAAVGWMALRGEADRAELARARRDPDEEAAAIAAAGAMAERMTRYTQPDPARPGPALLRGLGLLGIAEHHRAAGRSSPEAWRLAAELWATFPWPGRVAYARLREAEALVADPARRVEAGPPLREALDLAITHALPIVRAMAESLARRTRVDVATAAPVTPEMGDPVAPTSPVDPYHLTPREREVLALVALGHTNRRIAEALFISPKTAGVHVSNILAKLGVEGRVEAATIAVRLGIAEDSGQGSPAIGTE